MKLLMSEIFQKVSNAKTKAEKIQLLHQYNSQALRSLLIWNYDDSVVSMIPSGVPPYKKNEAPAGTEHTYLEQESRLFYHFVKGGNDSLNRTKREQIFIQVLESVHQDEAELLLLVKDKKLQDKYKITKNIVKEAFPEIQWGNRS